MLREKKIIDTLSTHDFTYLSEDGLEIKFQKKINKNELNDLIDNLFTELGIPFSLNIDNDENVHIPNERETIDGIFIKLLSNEIISIIISLKKSDIVLKKDDINQIIFYNSDNLFNHLNQLSFDNFTNYIFSNKSRSRILIINDENTIKYTNGFIFISDLTEDFTEEEYNSPMIDEIENRNNKFKKLSSGEFSTLSLIPEQIYVPSEELSIHKIFNKWCYTLCLSFLSSYTEAAYVEKKIIFHYQGPKKIKLFLDLDYDLNNDLIFEFYEWIYSEKTEDKLKLFQNLFPSLYGSEDEIEIETFLKILQSIVSTTKENFNFFIQDNIKTFVEERKKIEDLVTNTGNQISLEINKITELLIKMLSGIFLSVLTSILAALFRVQHLSYISYALYLFAAIIIITTIYVISFSAINIKISKKLFDTRINEYKYLFDDGKFNNIKKSVTSRSRLFYTSVFLTSIIISIMAFFVFSLGKYFQNQGNGFIEFLKTNINNMV